MALECYAKLPEETSLQMVRSALQVIEGHHPLSARTTPESCSCGSYQCRVLYEVLFRLRRVMRHQDEDHQIQSDLNRDMLAKFVALPLTTEKEQSSSESGSYCSASQDQVQEQPQVYYHRCEIDSVAETTQEPIPLIAKPMPKKDVPVSVIRTSFPPRGIYSSSNLWWGASPSFTHFGFGFTPLSYYGQPSYF